MGCTLTPPGEYHRTVRVRRRCSLFVKLLYPLVFIFTRSLAEGQCDAVCWNLLTDAQLYEKSHLKWPAMGSLNFIEGHWRSPKIALIDRPYITSYQCYVVTTSVTSPSCTGILPLLPCRWLSVTSTSHSFSIRQLKLQPTYAIRFAYEHIIVISAGLGLKTLQTTKVTCKVTGGY